MDARCDTGALSAAAEHDASLGANADVAVARATVHPRPMAIASAVTTRVIDTTSV